MKKLGIILSILFVITIFSACTKDDAKTEDTSKDKQSEKSTAEDDQTESPESEKQEKEESSETNTDTNSSTIDSSTKDNCSKNVANMGGSNQDNKTDKDKTTVNNSCNTNNNNNSCNKNQSNNKTNDNSPNKTNSNKMTNTAKPSDNSGKIDKTNKNNKNNTSQNKNINNKANNQKDANINNKKQPEDTKNDNNNKADTTDKTNTKDKAEKPYAKSFVYSNLVDEGSQKLLKDALLNASIDEKTIGNFLDIVNDYNSINKDAGLINEFKTVKSVNDMHTYDLMKIDENWLNKHGEFIGYNCRLTVYMIANSLVTINGKLDEDNRFLFLDQDAMMLSNNDLFDDETIKKFNTIFSTASTDLVKDIDIHLEKYKKHLETKGITYIDNENISIISVIFHSDLDNILFVGHTGVLVKNPSEDGLLFIEKISFQEPYQLIKFSNRQELSDYLMAKYDVEHGQPTAKPFITENGKLIEGYRPNPENTEE